MSNAEASETNEANEHEMLNMSEECKVTIGKNQEEIITPLNAPPSSACGLGIDSDIPADGALVSHTSGVQQIILTVSPPPSHKSSRARSQHSSARQHDLERSSVGNLSTSRDVEQRQVVELERLESYIKWLLDDISKIKTEATWGVTAVTFTATFASLAYQNRPVIPQDQIVSNAGPSLIKDILLLFTFTYAAAAVLQYRFVQQVCPTSDRIDAFEKVQNSDGLATTVEELKKAFVLAGKRIQAAEFSMIGVFGNALLISYLSTPASFTQTVGVVWGLFAAGLSLALICSLLAFGSYIRKSPR